MTNKFSILLPIDGSAYSRSAAALTWEIAKRAGATVVAQHVVDTTGVRELIGHDVPGFLPSNPYSVTYDHICLGLHVMARVLQDNYKEAATKCGVQSPFHIDEGDPVGKICERAEFNDLVVIGHRRDPIQPEENHHRQIKRLSIAESLAHECPKPLLIVQEKPASWQTMTIMLSMDHVNEYYIDSCIKFANFLGLTPEILCLSSGQHEEPAREFLDDLRKAHSALKDTPLSVSKLSEICQVNGHGKVQPARLNPDARDWSSSLPVMPTRRVGQERLTVLDDSPSLFVRYLAVPSMLLMPEEFVSGKPSIADRQTARNSGMR
jgi:nucleotide-binding universal stress UspA family protein